jgi:predicted nucleotidyltransferase
VDTVVNAQPLLARIARALAHAKLDAVLIGNAAAALQGAPVTTLDFDFFFRDTAANRKKIVAFARELGAIVLRPYYPASSLFRVTDDDLVLQADFMGVIHGLRSFEGVKKRASTVEVGGTTVRVASLEDIVKSKKAANRPRDRAVLPPLKATLRNAKRRKAADRRAQLESLRRESDHELRDMIVRLLAKPMHERTHFLRRRLPGGGSAL